MYVLESAKKADIKDLLWVRFQQLRGCWCWLVILANEIFHTTCSKNPVLRVKLQGWTAFFSWVTKGWVPPENYATFSWYDILAILLQATVIKDITIGRYPFLYWERPSGELLCIEIHLSDIGPIHIPCYGTKLCISIWLVINDNSLITSKTLKTANKYK